MQFLLYALIATGYVMFVAIAILLVQTYRRTHDAGFIWLGIAVLIWPLVARGLGIVIERGGIGPFPITGSLVAIIRLAQQISSLALLMVAILQLGKSKTSETHAI